MPADEQETYYVGMDSPRDIRRDLLGSSKRIIIGLKRFESFKERRKERVEDIIKLSKAMKEITFLNNKLKSFLPKTTLREVAPTPVPTKGKKAKKAEAPAKVTELHKLEAELSRIESKLEGL